MPCQPVLRWVGSHYNCSCFTRREERKERNVIPSPVNGDRYDPLKCYDAGEKRERTRGEGGKARTVGPARLSLLRHSPRDPARFCASETATKSAAAVDGSSNRSRVSLGHAGSELCSAAQVRGEFHQLISSS